jgi:hypothetical protein
MRIRILSRTCIVMRAHRFHNCGCPSHWCEYRVHFKISLGVPSAVWEKNRQKNHSFIHFVWEYKNLRKQTAYIYSCLRVYAYCRIPYMFMEILEMLPTLSAFCYSMFDKFRPSNSLRDTLLVIGT